MNHYFAERLKEFGRINRPNVTPLVLLSINELEGLQGYFEDILLSDVLESFLGTLCTEPGAIFFARRVPILERMDRRAGPILRCLDTSLIE